jgi:GNAT superfamily N-acetyltransferase
MESFCTLLSSSDLHILVTDPDFQGRGAGKALLQWGFQKADSLAIPVYLESSDAGHPVYLKTGFSDIGYSELDVRRYGGKGEPHRSPLMLREPKSTS